jgi:hypothetical protein
MLKFEAEDFVFVYVVQEQAPALALRRTKDLGADGYSDFYRVRLR